MTFIISPAFYENNRQKGPLGCVFYFITKLGRQENKK